MNRKIWAAICFASSAGLHVYLHLSGRSEADPGWLLWPLIVGITAFWLPAMLQVCVTERFVGFAPWGDGHTAVTYLWLTLAASLIWFFPAARIERWFGAFDAFKGSDRPRPRLLGAAVFVFEQVNKRLFGRQKTGGWA